MTTIYHNARCSKSRAALQTLEAHGLNPTVIDYQKTPFNLQELSNLIKHAGLTVHEAIRTKEPIYKQLNLSANSTEDELLAAIINNPGLLNRPFVVTKKGTRLARTPETLAEIL